MIVDWKRGCGQKWMLAEDAKNGCGAKFGGWEAEPKMDAVEGTRSGCSSQNWMLCERKD